MERDFRYLRDKHGDAGARDIFEKICTQLLQSLFGHNAHGIRCSQGDGGIDIVVGDFASHIDNYQCKYFVDGIGDAQKSQIRKSFKTAIESDTYKMKRWILCVPCTMSLDEFKWWSYWRNEQRKIYNSLDIDLWDGGYLISKLKQQDIYDSVFDNETKKQLDEIQAYLSMEKQRIENEIIVLLKEIDTTQFEGMTFVNKLESANIKEIDGCIQDYFNAELSEQVIKSKGNDNDIRLLENLKTKIYTLWATQYRRYQDETDGNDLLTRVYVRVEDTDTTTLQTTLSQISLLSKKGILHQWAEECSIGWLIDYKQKLEDYKARKAKHND